MLNDFLSVRLKDDLSWALTSPSLVNIPAALDGHHWLSAIKPRLDDAEKNLDPFQYRRLGLYYEGLLEALIRTSDQCLGFDDHIQVFDQKRTVGELDFVVHTPNATIHIECAVKFYLCTGDGSRLSHFCGTKKKDRLDVKWTHMLRHQLALSKSSLGVDTLAKRDIHITQWLGMLQGYLFFNPEIDQVALHPAVATNTLRGWWLTLSQASNFLNDDLVYSRMEKPYWINPVLKETFSKQEIIELLSSETFRPSLFMALKKNPHTGLYEEVNRGFIVPDNW